MLKRLLTLLAILSGLAAIGAPAHARYAPVQGIGVQLAGEGAAKCQNKRLGEQARPLYEVSRSVGKQAACPKPVITIVIPTVQLHADRSLQ